MADAPAASQANTSENASPWAPGWQSTPVHGQPTSPQPKSFEQAFTQNADVIAKELGLDTNNVQQAKSQPQQKKQEQAEPEDPQGDEELELSGKRIKRKDLAKQMREYEALQKKHAELEKGSGQKFRQAAEAQKQAQAQLAEAQRARQVEQRIAQVYAQAQQNNDPDLILKEFGIDPENYRQRAIQKAYEDAQKSPEQREIDRLKAYEVELQRVRQDQQKAQAEFQKQQQARQQQEQTSKLAGTLSQSMIATADKMQLPKTALTIQRMANLLAGAKERGIDPTWEQLGEATRKQYFDDASSLFDNMTAEQFHSAIPQKTREKIRQFFLKSVQSEPQPQHMGAVPQPRRRPEKQMTTAEYNAFINQIRS